MVAISCIAAGGILVGSIESAAKRERTARAMLVANTLARSFATPLSRGEHEAVQRLIDQIEEIPEQMPEVTRLVVTDGSRRVLAHSDPTLFGTLWDSPGEEDDESLVEDAGPPPRLVVRVPVGMEVRFGTLEVELDPQLIGNEARAATRMVVVVLLLMTLSLATGLSLLLSRAVAHPIQRLSAAVARYDGGAPSLGLAPHGPAEVQSLVRAFDEMAGRLHQHTGDLENAVEARTLELQQAYVRLSEANLRLQELAVTDPLTGLSNRRAFAERLHLEFERARRLSRPLTLILMDIDHFKQLNDRLGHLQGDLAITRVADLLRIGRRASDLVARWGGEEFALLLPETTHEDALALADKLRGAIQWEGVASSKRSDSTDLKQSEFLPVGVTISAGVATVPDHASDGKALVAAADTAMYAAKNAGRNRVCSASGGCERIDMESAS